MNVSEAVMPHRVDLDQLAVRPADVHVVVVRAAQRSKRRVKRNPFLLQPLVLVSDVDTAPADVPERAPQLARRRRGDLREQDERTLGEERVGYSRVTRRSGAEDARVEL